MNRRSFLTTLVLATATYNSLAKFSLVAVNSNIFTPNSIPLKSGDVFLAKDNLHLNLPQNPSNGDFVQIIIDNSSLRNPCVIDYQSISIAGDKEPLVLDSMANFKLTYDASKNDWKIG